MSLQNLIDYDVGINKEIYIKNALSEHKRYLKETEAAISRVDPNYQNILSRVRLFIDGKIDDKLAIEMLSTLFSSPQSLESYFNDKQFCLAINNIGSWSDFLWSFVADEIMPHWEKKVGYIGGAIDIYAFIGKYELTPFNVHMDNEDSYLFNLGPSMKYAYVWPNSYSDYASAISLLKPSNIDLIKKLENVVEYCLEPGDALLIPKGMYHVLSSKGYSVMLGFAPYNLEVKTNSSNIISRALRHINDHPLLELYQDQEKKQKYIIRELHEALSSLKNLELLAEIEQLKLSSNLYQIEPHAIVEVDHFCSNSNFSLFHKKAIKYKKYKNRLYLFCRGHEISFGNISAMLNIIQFIYTNNVFSPIDLVNVSGLDIEEVNKLIQELCKYGGIYRAKI